MSVPDLSLLIILDDFPVFVFNFGSEMVHRIWVEEVGVVLEKLLVEIEFFIFGWGKIHFSAPLVDAAIRAVIQKISDGDELDFLSLIDSESSCHDELIAGEEIFFVDPLFQKVSLLCFIVSWVQICVVI